MERKQYKLQAEQDEGFISGKNPAVFLTTPKALTANKEILMMVQKS